jgi:hypothetical protein
MVKFQTRLYTRRPRRVSKLFGQAVLGKRLAGEAHLEMRSTNTKHQIWFDTTSALDIFRYSEAANPASTIRRVSYFTKKPWPPAGIIIMRLNGMVTLEKARWQLAVIWFPAAAVLFIILVLQSLGGTYGSDLQRVWGWALPNFLPTIALMLSVFAAEALRPRKTTDTHVQKNFCTLASWLSVFYLAMLFLSILSPPVLNYFGVLKGDTSKAALLETSNLWLGPLQGLVVVALGVLFFLKKEGPTPNDAPAAGDAK